MAKSNSGIPSNILNEITTTQSPIISKSNLTPEEEAKRVDLRIPSLSIGNKAKKILKEMEDLFRYELFKISLISRYSKLMEAQSFGNDKISFKSDLKENDQFKDQIIDLTFSIKNDECQIVFELKNPIKNSSTTMTNLLAELKEKYEIETKYNDKNNTIEIKFSSQNLVDSSLVKFQNIGSQGNSKLFENVITKFIEDKKIQEILEKEKIRSDKLVDDDLVTFKETDDYMTLEPNDKKLVDAKLDNGASNQKLIHNKIVELKLIQQAFKDYKDNKSENGLYSLIKECIINEVSREISGKFNDIIGTVVKNGINVNSNALIDFINRKLVGEEGNSRNPMIELAEKKVNEGDIKQIFNILHDKVEVQITEQTAELNKILYERDEAINTVNKEKTKVRNRPLLNNASSGLAINSF